MCVGAQRPDVLEAGACVRRCPEARLSLEAGLTYIGASKPPRHAARLVRIDGMPPSGARPHFGIYIYIYIYISIFREQKLSSCGLGSANEANGSFVQTGCCRTST